MVPSDDFDAATNKCASDRDSIYVKWDSRAANDINSVIVDDLTPLTKYRFRIRQRNKKGIADEDADDGKDAFGGCDTLSNWV